MDGHNDGHLIGSSWRPDDEVSVVQHHMGVRLPGEMNMSTRKFVLIGTIGIACALSAAAIHARDLEPGPDRVANHAVQPSGSTMRVSAAVAGRSAVTPGLSRSDFERELSERFVGTHLLYQTLTEEAKGEVYGQYQDDNDIASIRRVVAYSM
jgi:hypothetical protein